MFNFRLLNRSFLFSKKNGFSRKSFKTIHVFIRFIIMEFPHELKELFPNEIIEVRGNAEDLTVILTRETSVKSFAEVLKNRFNNLNDTYTLYLRNEDHDDFLEVILE